MRHRGGVRVGAFLAVIGGLILFGPAQLTSGQTLQAPLTVVKVVSGTAPAGIVFTVTITCSPGTIVGSNPSQATMMFTATGQPIGTNTIGFDDPTQCTVTETVTGGAATVQYSCTSVLPASAGTNGFGATDSTTPTTGVTGQAPPTICAAAGPQTAPMVVNIEFSDQSATVTVTNTFVPPPPPAVVVAAFTG